MVRAQIPSFDRELVQLPCRHSSYNDDVKLEAFQAADMTYAGKQRKGIHENFESCTSMQDHVLRALDERFPLAAPIPLPEHIEKAAVFTRDCPPEALMKFWDSQLSRLEQLVDDSKLAQLRWNDRILPDIAPAAGKLKTVAISQLMHHFGVGGQKWIHQFALGFPITGTLSQLKAFERGKDLPPVVMTSQLFRSAPERFRERAAKSGMANAQQLWDEASAQVSKGWLAPPQLLDRDGQLPGWQANSCNVAFRFGVKQDAKLRACDDLKHSLTNQCCQVRTPIQLVSWDHLAQLSKLCGDSHDEWHLFKADHVAAYKQLPIDPRDQCTAIVALRHPQSKKWYGFVTRTLVFVSVAAVLHYNILSGIWSTIFARSMLIPLLSHFDDFAALLRAGLAEKALSVFTRFCDILGFQPKAGKSSVGNKITLLGLLGTFPSRDSEGQLLISLPDEKRVSWSGAIKSFLAAGAISHSCLEKLIGRLSFSQTSLFGKFARTQLRPLYQKFHRRWYNAQLSTLERRTFEWWHQIIADFTPRAVTSLLDS